MRILSRFRLWLQRKAFNPEVRKERPQRTRRNHLGRKTAPLPAAAVTADQTRHLEYCCNRMSRLRQESPTLNPLLWLAGVILILYFAREVLIPLALALTLNFLLSPMVARLQRMRMRRVLAVAI